MVLHMLKKWRKPALPCKGQGHTGKAPGPQPKKSTQKSLLSCQEPWSASLVESYREAAAPELARHPWSIRSTQHKRYRKACFKSVSLSQTRPRDLLALKLVAGYDLVPTNLFVSAYLKPDIIPFGKKLQQSDKIDKNHLTSPHFCIETSATLSKPSPFSFFFPHPPLLFLYLSKHCRSPKETPVSPQAGRTCTHPFLPRWAGTWHPQTRRQHFWNPTCARHGARCFTALYFAIGTISSCPWRMLSSERQSDFSTVSQLESGRKLHCSSSELL